MNQEDPRVTDGLIYLLNILLADLLIFWFTDELTEYLILEEEL